MAEVSSASTSKAAEPDAAYDLTQKMTPFLDVHFVFSMIHHLKKKKVYDVKSLQRAYYELLTKTNMIDHAIASYHELMEPGSKPPQDLLKRKNEIEEQAETLRNQCGPLLSLVYGNESEESTKAADLHAENLFTREHLAAEYGVTDENIDALYKYAKLRYESGEYPHSTLLLFYYRELCTDMPEMRGDDIQASFKALWGKLASEIVDLQWEDADRDREMLKGLIDRNRSEGNLMQLQQRSWLLHWSLFVFFNTPSGRDNLVDFFLQDHNLNAIQMNCPWLLRYLTVMVIVNNRRRNALKDVIAVIQEERHNYRDPIIEFMESLLINFDFDEAQEKLRACESALRTDYFFCMLDEDSFVKEFMDNARLYIFETYCRIHRKIDISMLADKLGMGEEAAEAWVVELIRHAHLDATIDCSKRQVVMGVPHSSVHQSVIDKTKDLAFRTQMLANMLENAVASNRRRRR